jgi:hypothetical protein
MIMAHSSPPDGDDIEFWSRRLLADGYCVIPDLAPAAAALLDADLAEDFAATPFCEGGFYGARTRRFGRLLARSQHAAGLVCHRLITRIVERILSPWCDTLQLNLTQAIALHPGALPQLAHRDQDMWRGETGRMEYLVNVMWPFTPYRADNGATLVWPGSHGSATRAPEPDGDPVAIEMMPGSALLFLGSTLHGAGGNRSQEIRRGCIISYCLGWLKPYENQWLAYPPEVARAFSPELAALVGYRQHRPNLGNYEGRCPSILLNEVVPERLAAIDALRPDQAEMVAAHVAAQTGAPA